MIKKTSRKLKKHKSTQKPFDPLSYTIRRSSGKKLTANEKSRALGKLTVNKSNGEHTAEDVSKDIADSHDATGVNRQPVTPKADMQTSSVEVNLDFSDKCHTHERSARPELKLSEQPAFEEPRNATNKDAANSRSQNKSPPRSAHQDSIPKKVRSPDLPLIKVGLISLFDGIGSVLPTFISRLQAYPQVFIAAECEEELRQLVSAHTGLQRDGKWTKLEGGTCGIYVNDVKKLLFNDCFILKEAAVLGTGCKSGRIRRLNWLVPFTFAKA